MILKCPCRRHVQGGDRADICLCLWSDETGCERIIWGQPIDCLAIGGSIDEDTNDLHLRFGSDTHGAIRITPLTSQNLIDRAHMICSNFLARERLAHNDEDDDNEDHSRQIHDWPEIMNVTAGIAGDRPQV